MRIETGTVGSVKNETGKEPDSIEKTKKESWRDVRRRYGYTIKNRVRWK